MIFAGSVFLLPVENVWAIANLNLSTSFTSADVARANSYMDQAGTWNGANEVTNSTSNGDRFTLRVQNSGTTAAFDLDITLALPNGFRLPNTGSTPVTVTSPNGCNTTTGATDFTPLNADQSGLSVDFNIPNNRNIPVGCIYDFEFGVTARNSAPFPNPGINNFTYNVRYDDGGPALNENIIQPVQVNAAVMALTKTALVPVATNGAQVDFRIDIRNTGTGGAFSAILTDTLSANFTGVSFISFLAFDDTTNAPLPVPSGTAIGSNQYRFNYIPPNMRIEVVMRTTATVNPTSTVCPVLINDASIVQRTTQSASNFATVEYDLPGSLTLTHEPVSYCELCGTGEVRLTVANTGGIALENILVREDFLGSGLIYVNGSTQVSLDGGALTALPGVNPTAISATEYEWDFDQIYTALALSTPARLDSPFAVAPPNPVTVQIVFQVRRNTAVIGINEEDLVLDPRNIEATSAYDLVCGGPQQNSVSPNFILPIREPVPVVTKLARNVDAGQGAGAYDPIIYGHADDDVIWRVEVQNTGLADMQDLLMNDSIVGANFDINWLCNSEAAATAASGIAGGGTPPAGCRSARSPNFPAVPPYLNPQFATTNNVPGFFVDDPFGNPNNDEPTTFIDVPVAGSAFVYYVGRIRSLCSNQTNNADIQWGCEVDPGDGGIVTPANGGGVIAGSADMSTNVVAAGLDVTIALTGSNQAQPLGTKGVVNITITNNSGGTVRLWNGSNPLVGVDVDPLVDDNSDTAAASISFSDILPVEYVMDRTFIPTAVMTPAYGTNYDGMVDSIVHTNPIADELANTAPRFRLYSSTQDVDPVSGTTYEHLIRHGDVLNIEFGIVLVDNNRYDLDADLDVAPEVNPGNDPDNTFNVFNQFSLNALSYCSANPTVNVNANYAANLEDLDVDTTSAIYILTNDPGTPLDLTATVTNNGGHDADDYFVYVTFGQAMTIQTAPAVCDFIPATGAIDPTTNPPPHPLWNNPAFIPASATVYRCYDGVIAPGGTSNLTFQVIRNAGATDDDLTFRADVVGEITLSDATPLVFPAPASIASTTPNLQLANNYTLDAIRARVLGFNLTKAQSATCTEDPPGATPDLQVRIGEDCEYFIRAGGWFGFDTPGFTLISVQDMLVTDQLPDGQGFINTDDGATSDLDDGGTPEIDGLRNITRVPATVPALTEGPVAWSFNQGAANALVERDQFFNLNIATRLLNDPVDPLYQPPLPPLTPNIHALPSTNIARASFVANYESGAITDSFCISDTPNVPAAGCIVPPGYPVESVRRIDLTVTEPNLIVTKEVCNETLYGAGTSCSNFVALPTLADDGDTQDLYIYRVTITNEASAGTPNTTRAPAFNVIVTDVLDSSDLMLIDPNPNPNPVPIIGDPAFPFDTDGLDNDGDGLIDGADTDGEYFSLTENVANGGTEATFVISNTHSVPLQRIDPGVSVTFYYRIDPEDSVAPLQTLSNTVSTTYDSLEGDSGNQLVPQLTNAENTAPNNSGRARIYDAIDDTASIRILPLQTQPKAVINVSDPTFATNPQNVVIGEEIEYELVTQLPVARMRQLTIRDELPPGISCAEAPQIDLSIYNAVAGFQPGGIIGDAPGEITCNDNEVQWNLGDQELTVDADNNNLFDFPVRFVARVVNDANTNEGCYIRNGFSAGSPAPPTATACGGVTETQVTTRYDDEAGDGIAFTLDDVVLNFTAADVVVREPIITITKDFQAVLADEPDADDILLVTVTVTNSNAALVPAYNIQVFNDLTNTNLTYVDDSYAGIVPPTADDAPNFGANRPVFSWGAASPGYILDPNETISFTYEVQVDDVVQPQEILDNAIEVRWTSLLDNTIALNSSGNIGVDGDTLGMRNGQFSAEGSPSLNPPNDYNATENDAVTVPELTIAKTDSNPGVLTSTIGEHREFQIVINLPEGISGDTGADVTRHVRVIDDLDALAGAGESYVLENDATYDITYQFPGIQAINDTDITALAPAAVEALFNSFPADETSGPITWNIGKVETQSEDDLDGVADTIDPQIIITYRARIDNVNDVRVNDDLRNNATLYYPNGESLITPPLTVETRTDDTDTVTVIEPDLTVTKVWSNQTPLKAVGDPPDGGDIIEYEVTIENVGNSVAYDINIRDNIPVWVDFYSACTPKAVINPGAGLTCATAVTNVAGFNATPNHPTPTDPLIWGRGNTVSDESLDLNPGDELVIYYQVQAQDTVETNQPITNSVVVDWTSLDGVSSLERNGGTPIIDCSAAVGANDYCAGPATSTATVANPNTVTKVADNDSYADPNDQTLRIGDTIEYTITINLQEGLTTSIDFVDTLPNGLELVSIDSVNDDTTAPYNQPGTGDNLASTKPFTYANIATPVVTNGAGANTITWTIGDVTNVGIGDNDPTNDEFIIVYTARVVDNEIEPEPPGPNESPTNATETLTNSVAGDFEDYVNTVIPLTASESIALQQPIITAANVTKVRRNATPSGTSLTLVDTTMDFQLEACNTGAAPAYDMLLEDYLDAPNWLDDTSITGPVNGAGIPDVYVNGVLVANVDTDPTATTDVGADYEYQVIAASPIATQTTMQFRLTNVAVDPGQCVQVNFDVDVNPAVFGQPTPQSWNNTFQLMEYHSLPATDPAANVAERETWGPVGPVVFNMNTFVPASFAMTKVLQVPGGPDYETTIGEQVTYRITVPAVVTGFDQYDVTVTDDLNASLILENAADVTLNTALSSCDDAGLTCAISNVNGVGTDLIDFEIDLIEAGEQAVIDVVVRVDNNATAQNTLVPFNNTASYTFADTDGGSAIIAASDTTINPLRIVEPELTLNNKACINITRGNNVCNLAAGVPDAGDILRYTLNISAAGGAAGDLYSDGFDITIIDNLDLGLAYTGTAPALVPSVTNSGIYTNTINAPDINVGGDGITVAQQLTWSLATGTANIDITEGDTITVLYDVVVLDTVQPDQLLENEALIQWSSRDGGFPAYERDGSGGVNNYVSGPLTFSTTTPTNNALDKDRNTDTFGGGDDDVRVGDVITYQVDLTLQEGTHNNLVVTDTIPQGMVFVDIQSINGDANGVDDYQAAVPFSYTDIPAANIVWSGNIGDDPAAGPTTLTIDMGNVVNGGVGDNNAANNILSIYYRVRPLNLDANAHIAPFSLQKDNSVQYVYDTYPAVSTTVGTGIYPNPGTYRVNLLQPNLTVTKTATQEFGDTIVVAGEDITYTVTITNNGAAPAYDVVLRDTLPFGMRIAGVATASVELPVGNVVANVAPTYDASYATNGIVRWDFDAGGADTYTIPPGQALQLVYTAEVDDTVGASATLDNSIVAEVYYSFDDEDIPAGAFLADREDYGPTAAAVYSLSTPAPSPLEKINPVNTDASIGIPFTYTITVPAAPVATTLYDVRILDNLDALAPNVDLIFVDVQRTAGTQVWTPVNTGTDTNLVIEDTTNGIDIPAGEQVSIELTVQVRNTSNNIDGDVFQNTASYTFNTVNDTPASQSIGGGDTTANMTIVEPLTMVTTKTAPVNMQYGVAGRFTVDIENTGNGPAYDLTIVDHLPDPLVGGMCDTPPDNFVVEIRDAGNVIQQTLTPAEYTTSFTPSTTLGTETTCTLTVTTQSPNAVMYNGWHLVVYYDAYLDADNFNGDMLVNYVAATSWFSADTPAGVIEGEIREYNEQFTLLDLGTSLIADHEDLAVTTVQAPELLISKTVFNNATNLFAATAEPADTLRYEITITNIGPVAAENFSLSDEVDRLNPAPGWFDADSLANVVVTELNTTTPTVVTEDPFGGVNGTGLIQITGLDLSVAGVAGDVLTITFEITLRDVIDSGNIILNQAEITLDGFSTLLSDDPASPGTDDPTETRVGSNPLFQLYKISDDITGDPNVLERGDILTYTITAKNIGAEDASITLLYDQIPANTTYVPNTTTLNGLFLNDPSDGVSPLETGLLVNAPAGPSGFMEANADPAYTDNIATVTFNVQVNDNVINGAVISNQAYVGGEGVGSGPFAEQLSDDPGTPDIVGDPTRDVVGNAVILDAQKTVEQITDLNSDDFIDAGETLRYTIAVSNAGLIDATGVVLTDNVPNNTTYVPNSFVMNGEPVPDGGVLPLIGGLDVSSDDLTPPLPASGAGTLSAGQAVSVSFNVIVNAGTTAGTIISNQATVTSNEYPDELTDADGNDINGDQPTEVTVGAVQQLFISKDVFVVGGGTAQPGDQLEYFINITNTGNAPIDLRNLIPNPVNPPVPFYIPNPVNEVLRVVDDVDQNGLITYVPGSARLNGAIDPNIIYDAPRLIIDFGASKRAASNLYLFDPGDTFSIRYLVQIDPNAAQGTNIVNTAAVDWGTEDFTPLDSSTFIRCVGGSQNVDACATSTMSVGGAPGVATLSGKAWHDSNFDAVDQSGERVLQGWEVQVYFGAGSVNPGDYIDSVFTDANGEYSISGLVPNIGDTKLYALSFVAPGAATDSASLGDANSIFNDGPQRITVFDLNNNSHTVDMNLPIQPNGVVYNAVTRTGVAGARLELLNPSGVVVPDSCFIDLVSSVDREQQNQVTLTDGYYKFELNFNDALCPQSSDYTIRIYPPAGFVDYDGDPNTDEISRIIPPVLPLTDPGYDVQTCSGDAVGGTPQCEVQASEFAPPTSEAPRTGPTDYYLKFNVLNFSGDDQLYNNHLPIDPELDSALGVTKTSPLVNVVRSQLVPYTISMTNTLGAPVFDINVVDNYPPGFKYVEGSSRIYINNTRVTSRPEEPVSLVQGAIGRSLTWEDFIVYENDVIDIKMLLIVGSGVGEGEYINRAQAQNNLTLGDASGEANATVRVVPDPTFDCSDIVGKVFDDKNLNGYQDQGEQGIASSRVISAQGLEATTDEFGRFHITCAVVPNQDRGSNFILKLDERSLPTGYRVTTENPRVQRATRGKMLKYNFGAAIHRVVRLDMADGVFEPGSTEMRPQWKPRLDLLITELAKDPSVLRLSYLAEIEDADLVDDRVDAVKEVITKRWEDLNCCYKLMIETEVFWRTGGPPDEGKLND